jgi:imidazolonepropionase-like amidohydrolase
MNRIQTLALAILALASGHAPAQPSGHGPLNPPANGPRRADPTWVAIHDCTLHPTPTQTLAHATIVFRDGRITAVLPGEPGPDGKLGTDDDTPARLPLGPRIVRANGLHVYAGFIEPYTEVEIPAPAADRSGQHWNPKITPQRNALDAGGIDEGLASSLRRLGFTAAAISPSGGIFRGSSAVVSLAKAPEDPSADKPPVYANEVYQSVAFETGGGYPSSLMGAVAIIRQTFSDADWQSAQRTSGALTGPDNAVDLLRKDKNPRYVWDCSDELNTLRAHKIAKEFGRDFIALGGGTEYQRLDAIREDGHRFILPINFPKAPDVAGVGKAAATELKTMMEWEQAPTNPRRLHAAGVPFILTTHRLRDRNEFFANVRLAIAAGYPETDALAAITTGPADLLGVSKIMGTLEPGKLANIVVMDGPLFDRKSKVRAVWVDGREHTSYTAPLDMEGKWDIALPGAPAAERWLDIGKGDDITLHRDDKSVKGTKVSITDGVLSFIFDHEPLDGKEGLYLLTGAISRDATGKPTTLTGQIVRPSGERSDFSATRRAVDPISKFAGTYDFARDGDNPSPFTVVVKEVGEKQDKQWKVFFRTLNANAETIDSECGRVEATADTLTCSLAATLAGWQNYERADVSIKRDKDGALSGTISAGPESFPISGSKRERDTPNVRGIWRIIEADGKPSPLSDPEFLSLEIKGDDVTLTLTAPGKDPTVIKAENVKIDKNKIEFTHPLAPLGLGEGNSSDVITVEGDSFVGISTLPDASTHTYRGWRKPKPKEEEKEDSLWRLAGVPDAIPVPFGPYGTTEPAKASKFTIFSDVTIWTSGPEGVIESGTVIIADGKITYVGKAPPPGGLPPDAIVIDGKGKHLTPGLIDAHSHTGISGGVNEGAQAVTSEVRIEDVTNPDVVNWYRQLAGGITTVLNLHGSANAIGGQSQVNKIRWGAPRPDDMHFAEAIPGIKFALGENPTGKNGSGDNGGQYPISRMGVEMLIRDRFTAAKEYLARKDDPNLRRDFELEALAEILEGKRLIHCHSYRQDEIVLLCRIAKDFGFKIGTFQHILEGYKVADYVRDYSGGGSGFADWWAYKVEVQDAIPQGLPLMHKVGAVVSFNSDSDEMARRMNVEAAKAVKYGRLSEEEALGFVTINPAKQLRIDQWVGTIQTGKVADLALWNGHPLSSTSKCLATWVDGVERFSTERDAAHRASIAAERQRLTQKLLAGNDKKKDGDPAPNADGERSPREAGPPAPGQGRRRRRPPEDEEKLERVKRALQREFLEGQRTHTQGMCGCGLEHDAYREQ